MTKPPPKLPQGNASILSGIAEDFSFHASPESFITSRILAYHETHPDLISTRAIVRARILNRNVAVVSSYNEVREILTADDDGKEASAQAFVAGPAYKDLMEQFFPRPNLLLADGAVHADMHAGWVQRIASLPDSVFDTIKVQTRKHFEGSTSATKLDLYASMKDLAWRLLLGIFLGLSPEDEEFHAIEKLQEDLLRGQFSLFPVRVNVGFWHSPRKKGIDARVKLQQLLLDRMRTSHSGCPFQYRSSEAKDVADHALLFTSSLAAKGLASLLTACLLNLYLHRDAVDRRIVDYSSEGMSSDNRKLLESMVLETERLSPPIVGVMRRCQMSYTVTGQAGEADILLPEGWDAWLYLVGAGRDETTFGESCNRFDSRRYLKVDTPEPMAFGAGAKRCLGENLVRSMALAVLESCISTKIQISGGPLPPGVRGWLGWDDNISPEQWSVDMKQLPTQRPSRPVMVRISNAPDRSSDEMVSTTLDTL